MMMSVEDEKGSMFFRREPAWAGHPDSTAIIVNGAPRPHLGGLQLRPQGLNQGARARKIVF
jgi:hypothetical protein